MLPLDLQILKYVLIEKPIYNYKRKPYFQWASYHRLKEALNEYEPNQELFDMPLEETPFTIFDLETTGLIPEVGHEIISIGAIQIRGFQHCRRERFHQFVRPLRPVHKHTRDLTGMTKRDISNASPFIEGFQHFLDFSKNSILVAHPADFDMRFLQTMIKRWKLPAYDPITLDSQVLAKWLYPNQRHQLDALIRYFDIEDLERHHALNDAIMTAELFEHLLRSVSEKNILTYRELIHHLDHTFKQL